MSLHETPSVKRRDPSAPVSWRNDIVKSDHANKGLTAWHNEVDGTLNRWCHDHGATVLEVFDTGWGSASGRVRLADGTSVVLKAPCREQITAREAPWLAALGQTSFAPRLLAQERIGHIDILILEDIRPGELLAPLHVCAG